MVAHTHRRFAPDFENTGRPLGLNQQALRGPGASLSRRAFPELEALGIGLRDIRDLEIRAIGECGTNTRAATIVATILRSRAVISGPCQVCRPQDFRLP
jgi:hypothetical protein